MSKRGGKVSQPSSEALKKEDIVQAVVICDTHVGTFVPMSQIKPLVLFPLVNMTLLDYTLEFLARSGVQEVILFCTAFSDEIKEHVKNSKWNKRISPITVDVIVSESCRTFGDAMRDLDAKAIIKGDFVLLSGGTVANLNLLPVLEYHRNVQKSDKGAVMTLLFKEVSPYHPSRDTDTLALIDTSSQRILACTKMGKANKKSTIPLEIFTENPEVELRFDLLDPGISICSAAVPPLFSDNFDFQTRGDFVKGLLLNEEILGSTMYFYQLKKSEYAAQVSSWSTYLSVSGDIIGRWVYPFVPDSNFSNVEDPYMFLRHHVYKQRSVTLSKGCVIDENVVIGGKTSIGENTTIKKSVVGNNCKIGNNVSITCSHIWNNVIIEDGCTINCSVVADNCVLKSGIHLKNYCAVGPGVTLKSDKIFENDFITKEKRYTADSGYKDKFEFKQVSEKAYVMKSQATDSDSEDEDEMIHLPTPVLHLDEEESDEDSEGPSLGSASPSAPSPVPDDVNLFYTEVLDSLARGFEEKFKCDNLILEINSSRYAYNVTVQEVNHNVVKAILSLADEDGYFIDLKTKIEYFMPLLKNYVKNTEAQTNCLEAIEEVASSREEAMNSVLKLLHLLYEKDVLEEDAILKWYESETDESSSVELRKMVTPFIVWLKEAEEESESDSD